ncbi:hypothetical protein Hanom_Chr17g01591001 [Helianthus anomalus]
MHFVTHLVTKCWGLNALQMANHRELNALQSAYSRDHSYTFGKSLGLNTLQIANHGNHPCTFGKSWGLNTLQSANHRDHLCTFEKLETRSKILVNHRDHPCTLLLFVLIWHMATNKQ